MPPAKEKAKKEAGAKKKGRRRKDKISTTRQSEI